MEWNFWVNSFTSIEEGVFVCDNCIMYHYYPCFGTALLYQGTLRVKLDQNGKFSTLQMQTRTFTPLFLHYRMNASLATEIEFLIDMGIPRRVIEMINVSVQSYSHCP